MNETKGPAALGLSEHQRHCGVHINTENMHMHVAYNLIHPERLTRVEPWRDYIKRDKLCRELEREYGLIIDNGREPGQEQGLGDRAAAVEAHTGQQSFEGYAHDQGDAILDILKTARTWEDVHKAFACHGLEVKPRGAGLVVTNRHGKQMAKASTVHRDLSLKKLESRFGTFQPSQEQMPDSQRRYEAAPLQKAPNRNNLWEEFQNGRKDQKATLEAIHQRWEQKRLDLQRRPIARVTRAKLLKMARQYEAEEIHAARMEHGASNWLGFLQQRAAQGDDIALAVLRSRNEEVPPETPAAQMQPRAVFLANKTAILENSHVSGKTKNRLVSVALMESLAQGITSKITTHGNVVYTLPNGGKICDTGKRISYSPDAREMALAYMSAKWNVKQRSVDKDTGDSCTHCSAARKFMTAKEVIFLSAPPSSGSANVNGIAAKAWGGSTSLKGQTQMNSRKELTAASLWMPTDLATFVLPASAQIVRRHCRAYEIRIEGACTATLRASARRILPAQSGKEGISHGASVFDHVHSADTRPLVGHLG